MKLFGKMFLCFICFNLTLMPLMAENASDYKDSEQIDSEIKKQFKRRKRSIQPNSPKGRRIPHVQPKCKYISELDEINQVGLNISQYLDIENFKALPRYFSGYEKDDNKREVTIKAVQYFNDLGLSDPKEIHNASKKYFQDLAKKAYENGKYLLAYNYFTAAIEGEKYFNNELDECKKKLAEKKNEFKHGDVFLFGKFEQDGNKENGPEPIEWIVLRDTGEEIILLSKYVLAHKPFDTSKEMFIWEDSTLCSWLNKEFYNEAFNEDEKRRMTKIGSDWYAEEYDGDYVVIPVMDDLTDLVDNFWLPAYAVPSDEAAQDFIDYEGKPFILKNKDKWYKYNVFWTSKQPNVLTSNEKVDKFSSFVYWPSGYWLNEHKGMTNLSNGTCEVEYTFCDENGFCHVTKAKYYNGVRPVIKVAYKNIEKLSLKNNSSVATKREFTRSELDDIHQLGLNIFKFMDYSSFDKLPYGNKEEKRNKIKTAIRYFADKEMSDPIEIHSTSKKYFKDLAEENFKNGDYKQAYKYFSTSIEGEKYEQPKLLECKKHIANNFSNLKLGDIVLFGKYEQDGNLENGSEPIEWIVLKKENNKFILLSKYVLTHRPIHSVTERFKWYESELCAWLNSEFYNEAFSEAEKKRMRRVGDNIWYLKEYNGDYVGLPCIEEFKGFEKHFLNAYAVPNDVKAKDCISFDWKPFTVDKDDKGNIIYEPESGFDFSRNRQLVLTMNPNIDNNSNLVYLPSNYWTSLRTGNGGGNGINWEFYRFIDENGISWGNADARNSNGVRPIIGIAIQDE